MEEALLMRMTTFKLSRREYLASLIGLPFVGSACHSTPESPLIDCSFAQTAVTDGHRLRDHERFSRPTVPLEPIDVAIVGGGAAGLSAGWRLKHAGDVSFRVLELEDSLGGTSRSGARDGFSYPWGAHYVPVPSAGNRSLIRLLSDLDLLDGLDSAGRPQVPEHMLVREPEERIFWHGSWYEGLYPRPGASAEDLNQLERFHAEVARWVAFRDGKGRRAFTSPISLCSDDAEVMALDRITFSDWLQTRGLTSWRLRWYADYACRDDYGTRLEETSAWAGLFYFASRVTEPGEESAPLMTWPEGNGRLIHGMLKQLGPVCRPGQLVVHIRPVLDDRQQECVEVWTFNRATRQLEGLLAKRVIFSIPLYLARHLVAFEGEPSWARVMEHSPWVVAQLFLRSRPGSHGFPDAWDNVLIESPSLGYVSATHQSLRDYGPTCWTWYLPLTGADVKAERRKLLDSAATDWLELALTDLQRAHRGLRSRISRCEVMRWGHAMIRPVPGLRAHLEAARKPYRGIHFAHTDLSGVALFEEAHDQGVRAAEEALLALGRREATFR